jgi:hypothetical protein
MVVMLLLLPEAHRRGLATLETAAAAYLFAELTISATDHLALSFLNVLPTTFGEWRRPTG